MRTVAGALAIDVILVQPQRRARLPVRQDGVSLCRQLRHSIPGLQQCEIAGGIIERCVPSIRALRSRILGVGVVHIKPRPARGDNIGHTNRIGVNHGNRIVALEIETARVPQGVFLRKIPARTRPRIQRGIGHNRMGRGNDWGMLRRIRRRNTVFRFRS